MLFIFIIMRYHFKLVLVKKVKNKNSIYLLEIVIKHHRLYKKVVVYKYSAKYAY